jgi:dihydrofolate synthase/folylpolyglutamate synthase
MLESIYRAAGLRVGLFTSPHLVSFRERIQFNRRLIPASDLIRLVEEIQPLLKQFSAGNHLTLFEVVTVMALKFFAEQKCDLVIWETGLGGRLDATNIVTPLASVITNIGLDHTQWLGETLEKIAAEKAGIIKPGVPVVTATAAPEALVVIENVARQNGSPLTRVDQYPAARRPPPAALVGDHQKLNAALALATVEVLQKQIPVSAENIRGGLSTVDWPGRLQLVPQPGGKQILLDGAHNAAGAEVLRAALEKHFAHARPLLIFGALADKNWLAICRTLAPLAAKIFTVPVASERTANARELAAAFRSANPIAEVVAFKNFDEALNASKDEPFIVVTGSLYLVGEALEQLGLSPDDTGERGLNEWSAAPLKR